MSKSQAKKKVLISKSKQEQERKNKLFQNPNINSPIEARQLKAMLIAELYAGILANNKTEYILGVPQIAPLLAAEAGMKELSESILDNCMLESFSNVVDL